MKLLVALLLLAPMSVHAASPAGAGAGVRLGDVVGAEVLDRDGERLGTVHDVVIDADRDRISYAVVAVQGPFGLGERRLAVSIPGEARVGADGRLVVHAPQGLAQVPLAASPRYRNNLHSASELLEARVEDYSGLDVGELRDIVIDPRDGTIEHAVVEVDDELVEPARVARIDMPAVRHERAGSNDLVLTVNRRALDAALERQRRSP